MRTERICHYELLEKIYCRTFQTGLKIALPFLPYRKPKIVGSVKALPDIIQKKKCSKVLIITDAGIRKLGLTRRLETALTNAGIPFAFTIKPWQTLPQTMYPRP